MDLRLIHRNLMWMKINNKPIAYDSPCANVFLVLEVPFPRIGAGVIREYLVY